MVRPNAFPAIVSQEVFDLAQARLDNMVNHRSNERLLAELKAYIEKHGKPLPAYGRVEGMAGRTTYVHRFGNWMTAYNLIHYTPRTWTVESAKTRRTVVALKAETMTQLRKAFRDACVRHTEGQCAFRLQGLGYFLVEAGRCYITPKGRMRWRVKTKQLRPNRSVIVIRLQPGNESIQDFVLLRKFPFATWGVRLSDGLPDETGTVHQSIEEVVAAIMAKPSAD